MIDFLCRWLFSSPIALPLPARLVPGVRRLLAEVWLSGFTVGLLSALTLAALTAAIARRRHSIGPASHDQARRIQDAINPS